MGRIKPTATLKPATIKNHFRRASRGGLFRLESLESRVLLSADPLLGGTLQNLLLNNLQDTSTQNQQPVIQEVLRDNSTYWQKDSSIVATLVAAPATPVIDVSNVSTLDPLNPVCTVGSNSVDADAVNDLQIVSEIQNPSGDFKI
ncbi:MAG: LEPR-XLL domain-containing protein, partial [Desulfuromonadales bacterium]